MPTPSGHDHLAARPAELVKRFGARLHVLAPPGPVLDLACGGCSNGLFMAALGREVVCLDASAEALDTARERAAGLNLRVEARQVDLETGAHPLPRSAFSIIIVLRYLHRPLLAEIVAALMPGGALVYETFTTEQPRFGKPTNPDFLLKPGELAQAFAGLDVLHSFEGVLDDPPRAVAQFVGCKPLRDNDKQRRTG